MEDKIAEIRMSYKEIASSIMVLRDAVSNDNKGITFEKIEDMLDILIAKMNKDWPLIDELIDEYLRNCLLKEDENVELVVS